MPDSTENELTRLEQGAAGGDTDQQPLVSVLLSETTSAVPLPAGTKASALKELVKVAEQSWQVYEPDSILEAIRQREEMGSTALGSGVAVPHPRRPMPAALGESVIAFGRSVNPLPFCAPSCGLSDL